MSSSSTQGTRTSGECRFQPGSFRTAFTLLEVVVVVAILVLLTTVALPAVQQARAVLKAAVCRNNLHQWHTALLLYAADHDDYLPPEGAPALSAVPGNVSSGWYIQLPNQIGQPSILEQPWRTNAQAPIPPSIWLCPANPRRSNGRNLFHYCLNEHLDGTGKYDRPTRLSEFLSPSIAPWLFDNGKIAGVAQQNNLHTNVHSRGANIAFLDGHILRVSNRDYWDFDRNRGRTNNPQIQWRPWR